MKPIAALASALLAASLPAQLDRSIRMPRAPRVAPDGAHIAFAWRGDVWLARIEGGAAVRLTSHVADDRDPHFSPDGEHVAFVSDRSGSEQIHVVPTAGGAPAQVTHGSLRTTLFGFLPGGTELAVGVVTDEHFHTAESMRLFAFDLAGEKPRREILDVGLHQAAVSPDGSKLLFVRGRPMWARKGYRGSQAAQLWLADLSQSPPALRRLSADRPQFQNVAESDPMWAPDGIGYYFVSDPDGTFDVFYRTIDGGDAKRITHVGAADRSDDGVAFPSLASDGTTLVFRRRFDLWSFDVVSGTGTPIELTASGDVAAGAIERTTEERASSIAFTKDGKQFAFVAGEDVYVMDRVLQEPVQVTDTPFLESSLAFSDDGKRLFFVSDQGGEVDVWEATHAREDGIWWLADEFRFRQITDDHAVESGLLPSPNGTHIAYRKDADLFVMDQDGSDQRRIVAAWSDPDFDWSPDGRWLVYATQDADYNSDVFLVPIDGTREPFNVSRHPDRDSSPVWSGDGKRIAFVSRRDGEESDVYWVNLTRGEEERTERDRRLEKALDAMKKKPRREAAKGDADTATKADGRDDGKDDLDESKPTPDDDVASAKAKEDTLVAIEFDGIFDRLHRIRIGDSAESDLVWSPDGKRLAFRATVDAERGFYAVEFPDAEKPTRLAGEALESARWLRDSDEIVGLSSKRAPAVMSTKGKIESFDFHLRHRRDWARVRQIAFDQGWRAMRDRFYDPAHNNRDWEAIRRKYRPVASQCIGQAEFGELMDMMLGELNASHMGHHGGDDPLPEPRRDGHWSPRTHHLGLRLDPPADGGARVSSVIPSSPCDLERSRVRAGEFVVEVDGAKVGPGFDFDRALTFDDTRDVELVVVDAAGNRREVIVRPATSVAALLYDEWVEARRAEVEAASHGTLGYLHIRGMNMTSFRQMEEDLYHAGHGKDGLIVDVRFNGGGSTTDHVLTALTQPVHAVTKSRGSGEGYPQDRKVYASWSKPVVLMCNEHSFSNAEILSHAIKQLGRGRLVGMRTAGGVISTGSVRLLDGSYVRMPMRGWYLATTGEDMELNGCQPDIALWNDPRGPDRQLAAAVEALAEDVAAARAQGDVEIEPAAARRARAREAEGGGFRK